MRFSRTAIPFIIDNIFLISSIKVGTIPPRNILNVDIKGVIYISIKDL